ncbi:pilus assembly PilX family protein [Paucibacter soli]|uniref:pilus assembly PilX family protein n=1 Tax=Paucibacter soli TaxID=3133433 RepID=UPI0030AC398C
MTQHPSSNARQRGVGTLVVTLTLMLSMSLVVFYLNRNVIFEQRTAANQIRSTEAMELAEGGMEWALGMLNTPKEIDTACVPTSSGTTFRKRYLAPSGTTFTPLVGVTAGCKRSGGAWTCSCPTSGNASLGSASERSFTVVFAAVAGQPGAVQISSYGCTAQSDACREGQTGSADASAMVRAVLKASPLLPGKPAGPITCGTSCAIGGSYNIVNNDVETNGVLVNAGTTISTSPGTSLTTIPGQPAANALVGADKSLADLASADPTCSNSRMFNAYFGTTMDEYRTSPNTTVLSCGSASDCKNQLTTAYDQGKRAFYFTSDVQLSGNGSLGTAADPVVFVTPNALKVNGNWDLYGMVFSNSADYNNLGTGAANIHGAIVSCAAYSNNGNGTAAYDPSVLDNLNANNGTIVRVPGSWRDW